MEITSRRTRTGIDQMANQREEFYYPDELINQLHAMRGYGWEDIAQKI